MTQQEILSRLRAELTKQNVQEERNYQIHMTIGNVLESFVGKKLTKRFTDKVTAAVADIFPSPPVCFYPHPGRLHIWHHVELPYDQREIFFIASNESQYNPSHSVLSPTLAGFEYEDQSHGRAALVRIQERRALLSPENDTLSRLATRIALVRNAKRELVDLCEPFCDNGVRYLVEKLVDEREEPA